LSTFITWLATPPTIWFLWSFPNYPWEKTAKCVFFLLGVFQHRRFEGKLFFSLDNQIQFSLH
jgi:hypothetical protein